MLPFLKRLKEGGASSGVSESIERKPDDGALPDMLDAVADDLLMAIEKKDKKLLKDALAAFAEHLQDQDESQDQQTIEGM